MTPDLNALDGRLETAGAGPVPTPDTRIRHDVVVVASGKGGVGTSTLAGLLALGVAREGRSTLIVDADGSPGSLPLLFDTPAVSGFMGAVARGATPDDLAVPVAPGLTMVAFDGRDPARRPGPSRGKRTASFRRLSSLYDEVDVSVIDAGSRLDTVTAACSGGAGRLITVTEPDRISVASNYALLKALETRIPGLPLEILVNRRSGPAAHGVFSPLRTAVDYFLHRSVTFAGAVPEDETLRRGVEEGDSLQSLPESTEAARALRRIATRIITEIDEGAEPASSSDSPRGRS